MGTLAFHICFRPRTSRQLIGHWVWEGHVQASCLYNDGLCKRDHIIGSAQVWLALHWKSYVLGALEPHVDQLISDLSLVPEMVGFGLGRVRGLELTWKISEHRDFVSLCWSSSRIQDYLDLMRFFPIPGYLRISKREQMSGTLEPLENECESHHFLLQYWLPLMLLVHITKPNAYNTF